MFFAVSSGFAFGSLDDGIEAFQKAIIDAGLNPILDAIPVILDGLGGFAHGLQVAQQHPIQPFLQPF